VSQNGGPVHSKPTQIQNPVDANQHVIVREKIAE
jgi:hypothetical protein